MKCSSEISLYQKGHGTYTFKSDVSQTNIPSTENVTLLSALIKDILQFLITNKHFSANDIIKLRLVNRGLREKINSILQTPSGRNMCVQVNNILKPIRRKELSLKHENHKILERSLLLTITCIHFAMMNDSIQQACNLGYDYLAESISFLNTIKPAIPTIAKVTYYTVGVASLMSLSFWSAHKEVKLDQASALAPVKSLSIDNPGL